MLFDDSSRLRKDGLLPLGISLSALFGLLLLLAGPAARAQTPIPTVENGESDTRLERNDHGRLPGPGKRVTDGPEHDSSPTDGAGPRPMGDPAAAKDGADSATVRAWRGHYEIPTYQLGPTNPYARFHQLSGKITYPYLDQQFFLNTKKDQRYRALFLENKYVKLTVLPERGGRVIEVLDKTTGEQVFHTNDVLKPARIALRGAFFSGGIEWNPGPQGHTTIVYAPVNSIIQRHEDGSASVVISNTQQDSQVRWRVRLTLHPGRAYLDERIRLANERDWPVPYYFWNNTAFYCDPQTRYVAPISLATDHGADRFFRWPIHDGRDLRNLGTYQRPTALFAYEATRDFFGVYHLGRDRGVVQWADHRELPGKKYWTFGEGQHGRYMQNRLTDTKGSHYIELQSGPLPTQSDYEFLPPRAVRSWREWWYPVHGLKDGFEYATRDVAIRARHQRADGSDKARLTLRLIATAVFPEATVTVAQNGETVHSESLPLTPDSSACLTLDKPSAGPVDIAVRDAQGDTLAAYTSPLAVSPKFARHKEQSAKASEEEQQKPAVDAGPSQAPPSASALYQKARERHVSMDPDAARKRYEKALERAPNHVDALRGLAVLDLTSGRYVPAERRLQEALTLEPASGMSHYYYGAVLLSMGRPGEALTQARETLRRPATRALGWDLAGRIYMRQGNPQRAAAAFEKARLRKPGDLRGRVQLAVAYYADERLNALDSTLNEVLETDPTEVTARALRAVREGSFEKAAFGKRMRTTLGDPVYEAITAASVLATMEQYALAERMLEAIVVTDVPAADRQPLGLYWLAWLAHQRGDASRGRRWLDQAEAAAHETVYPSRRATLKVLRMALDHRPADAHLRLYMGNLLAGLHRIGEAVPHWRAAAEQDSALGSAWRHLAKYHWRVEQDPEVANRLYKRAIAAHPTVQPLYRDRARILRTLDRPQEAIRLLTRMPYDQERRDSIVLELVRAYIDTGQYTKAIEQLTDHYFYPGEGVYTTHALFEKALKQRARRHLKQGRVRAAQRDLRRAETYPENLGVGREANN